MKIHNLVAPPRLFLLVLKTSEENITKSSRPRSAEPFQAQTGHFSSPSLCKRVTSGPWICVNGSLPVPEICTNRWPLIPERVFFYKKTHFCLSLHLFSETLPVRFSALHGWLSVGSLLRWMIRLQWSVGVRMTLPPCCRIRSVDYIFNTAWSVWFTKWKVRLFPRKLM